MTYLITYEADPSQIFDEVSGEERKQTLNKLYEVASSEFRSPDQFDVEPLRGNDPRWRFRVGNGIRVFLEIDQNSEVLRISRVSRRENLYQ